MTIPPTLRGEIGTEQGAVYALSEEVSPSLLDGNWLHAADRVFVWEQPSRGRRIVGLGGSVVHRAAGPERFGSMGAAVGSTLQRLEWLSSRGPGPRFVGGFGFGDDEPGQDSPWRGYNAAAMVLPEITLISKGGTAWAVATSVGGHGDRARATALLKERIGRLEPPAASPETSRTPVVVDFEQGASRYRNLVAAAAASISSGSFDKVVLARSVEALAAIDPSRVLDALRTTYPGCVTFAVTSGSAVFLGATPELLVELSGRDVRSVALAGSIGRGTDSASDRDLEERLLADPKEREEHQHVVAGIWSSLNGLTSELDPVPPPNVRKLATVQHLETPITGRLGDSGSLFELVGALHPTPAVGGMPESGALDWIAAHEGLDRGWYAAPLGFVDHNGDGEFHVALRCALVRDQVATCFVGAGIVAGSDPERELAETTTKLRAIADALAG